MHILHPPHENNACPFKLNGQTDLTTLVTSKRATGLKLKKAFIFPAGSRVYLKRWMQNMRGAGGSTARLTGTAILAALVVVFDYALKFSGLKIPFPWMPFLKFDFTGVPIVVSLLLFGLSSGATTSIVACLGIVARSGDLVGGAMKSIAEFSTILGIAAGLYIGGRLGLGGNFRRLLSVTVGVATRIAVMSLWNLIILPFYYGLPFSSAVGMLPLLGVFNGIQGTITASLGYLLYEAYVLRVPTQGTGDP
jgi:riboflavin transporter FmnP